LGVEKTATQDQIKTAYRKAALKWHPGKSLHSVCRHDILTLPRQGKARRQGCCPYKVSRSRSRVRRAK
jgi:curved DNA-binding protein CbpA